MGVGHLTTQPTDTLSQRLDHEELILDLDYYPLETNDYRNLRPTENLTITFISIIENLRELENFKAVYPDNPDLKD